MAQFHVASEAMHASFYMIWSLVSCHRLNDSFHSSCATGLNCYHIRRSSGIPNKKTPSFAYAKTKAQISFAVTAKLISAFVFAPRIVQFLYFLKPKFPGFNLAIFCACTVRFVSDLGGNPEGRFSGLATHIRRWSGIR